MKNTTKLKNKIIALLLTALIILGVSGCSEGDYADNGEDSVAAEEITPTKKEGGLWYQLGADDAYIFSEKDFSIGLYADIVPDEVLKSMSTIGLIETIFSYPHLTVPMIVSNTGWLDGAKKSFTELSVFKELMKREDAGSILTTIYNGLTLKDLYNEVDYDVLELRLFEYLLIEEQILNRLTVKEKETQFSGNTMEYRAVGRDNALFFNRTGTFEFTSTEITFIAPPGTWTSFTTRYTLNGNVLILRDADAQGWYKGTFTRQ